MLLTNEKYENVYQTLDFVASAAYYIYKCAGYRVEILATNRDTCNDTELPTMYDLIDDVLVAGVDEEDDCYLYLPVTDNYFSDYPFACHMVKEDGKTILSSIDAIDGLQQVGDNMYPLFSDTRGKDAMIDWQFKIMDYVYDMLETVPYGTVIIVSKEELHKHVCPEREVWCPLGSRHFWPIPDMLELCGIKVNSNWKYTMDTWGYFVAMKERSDE